MSCDNDEPLVEWTANGLRMDCKMFKSLKRTAYYIVNS